MIVPPFLKAGDTIGIVPTARGVQLNEITSCINFLEAQGFHVKLANNVGKVFHRFAGTDTERTTALQSMLDDPDIKAILCARGGYGTTRMLADLKWEQFLNNPKWICGYSDITALHGKVNRLGIASLHSRMAYDPRLDLVQSDADLQDLVNLLKGQPAFQIPPIQSLKNGQATGQLVGGNLTLLNNAIGTDYQPDFQGAILLIEDVDEYLYNIDRIMYHWKACGILDQIYGIVLGSFTAIKDDEPAFGYTVQEIMLSITDSYSFPIIHVDCIGHGKVNIPMYLGRNYQMDTSKNVFSLHE